MNEDRPPVAPSTDELLTELTREVRSLSERLDHRPEKPKTSGWEKAKVVSGMAAAILVPVAIAGLGYFSEQASKKRDLGARMVELALTVVQRPTDTEEPEEAVKDDLHSWALDLLEKYSEVEMGETARRQIRARGIPPEAQRIIVSVPCEPATGECRGPVVGFDEPLYGLRLGVRLLDSNCSPITLVLFDESLKTKLAKASLSMESEDSELTTEVEMYFRRQDRPLGGLQILAKAEPEDCSSSQGLESLTLELTMSSNLKLKRDPGFDG